MQPYSVPSWNLRGVNKNWTHSKTNDITGSDTNIDNNSHNTNTNNNNNDNDIDNNSNDGDNDNDDTINLWRKIFLCGSPTLWNVLLHDI